MAADEEMVFRLLLAGRLRQMREDKRGAVTQAQAAAAVSGSPSKISRMEAGKVSVRPADAEALLRLYGAAGDVQAELLALARAASRHGWWEPFSDSIPPGVREDLALEAAADGIFTYNPMAVPAVLQTPEYSDLVCRDIRLERPWQAGLDTRALHHRAEMINVPGNPHVVALLPAAVLRRPPGGDRGVLLKQVSYLLHLAESQLAVIQVIPDDSPVHTAAPGPFSLLRFGPQELGDVVLLESMTGTACLRRREDVDMYLSLFSRILVAAHPPEASAVVLADACRGN